MKHLAESDLARLASFPEQNPNPVIELALNGDITYLNPAAQSLFPGIRERGISHELFDSIRIELDKRDKRKDDSFRCEVTAGGRIYDQRTYLMQSGDMIRVYSADITELKEIEKRLATLALFPEQNPNPVIEVALSGEITYMNPAARQRFKGMETKGLNHRLFASIRSRIASIRQNTGEQLKCEVEFDGSIYEQKVYFIPQNDVLRVYSSDITEQKNIEKNLARLASFPEQNPNPVIEVSLYGEVSYMNPAAGKRFPGLKEKGLQHPLFGPLRENLHRFQAQEITSLSQEIVVGEHTYEQKLTFMPDNQIIRVYSSDITERKQAEEIIREKNKEITDSIRYARRIQEAILPPESQLARALPGAFVLYKPKDIVSGDFYWFTQVDRTLVVAAADCTGHGVPGAFMSMIGNNLLNHIMHDGKVTSPGQALYRLDEGIKKILAQGSEQTNDGMDIALCFLALDKLNLSYAGAYRPLVLVRNGALTEYKASSFAIGGQQREGKSFTDNDIQLIPGDRLYLFTDGYTDQFGGEKGKKFMRKKFYDLLASTNHLSMGEQKAEIDRVIEEWKAGRGTKIDYEQVDDILVIGLMV
jgi:serine phosphatase RsbU (regulator of sigma subunit)